MNSLSSSAGPRPARRLLLPGALGVLATLALGCAFLDDAKEDVISAVEETTAGEGRGGSGRGSSSRSVEGVPAARPDAAPVYVMLHTHHYRGNGGYYPTAQEVRDIAEVAVEAGIDDRSTLFFDGLLVDKLMKEDASVISYIKGKDFAIGYHGEESHGPYPVVVSVEQVSRNGTGVAQVGKYGYSFEDAVNAIQYRYCHGYEGCEFGADGYLSRFSGGETDDSVTGGIRLVRQQFGREIEILPGHSFYNPAAGFAFANESAYVMLQGAGVFAPHFLGNTGDKELQERTHAFLGDDNNLMWYMGRLAEKGMEETQLALWSEADFAEKASGGKSGGGGGSERPPKSGSGQRPPRGAGYFGPHLLPFSLPDLGGSGLLGALPTWLDQAQGGRPPGATGGSQGGRPPKSGSSTGGDRPPRGAEGGQQPPRGAEGSGDRPPRGAEGGQQPPRGADPAAGASRKSSSSGTPGADTKTEAAALSRRVPQVASMKMDGRRENIADCVAFFKAWSESDSGVQLVTPALLREKVHDPEVKLDAEDTARAVQEYWSKAPADFLVVSGTYATLAEGWEVMARHLAGEGDRIETTNVLGPVGRASELVNGSGTVTGSQVRAAAKTAWAETQSNRFHAMPTAVTVGGTRVGFHQFYWMMSEAILKGDDARITVPSAGHAPPFAALLAGKIGRENPDQTFWMEAQFWTVKPVTWK